MLHRCNLHAYQLRAIKHIKTLQNSALFLDMGLGKTVSTLTATQDILDGFLVTKVLIVAPLRVANTVWHNEAKQWSHLQDLRFSIVTGNLKNRLEALNKQADVYVVNRENVSWLTETFKNKLKFDMLIIDESSSFKNPTSKRFRALKKILPKIKKAVILTGTPSPNGYIDLWSQIFILDRGESLGRNITMYRNTFFDSDYMGYTYKIKEGADEIIQNKIKHLTLSMNTEDYLTLPEQISSILDTPLPKNLLTKYNKFKKEFITNLNNTDISAVNSATLSNKLLQFSSGAIYDEDNKYHEVHNLKFDSLDEVLDQNPDENILVAYNFKHEKERLLKRYSGAVMLDKKGLAVDLWNKNKIKILLVHPASAGHGLNLQFGGSILVWFGFNWSLELYQQLNKRLHRQGQTKVVKNIHIAVGDIEYHLMSMLAKKDVTQKQLLESLK